MQYHTEHQIELLKDEFKTVEFVAGTVGFVMRKGTWQIPLPYYIFDDPNWRLIVTNAVTVLETAVPMVNDITGSELL